MNKNNKNQKDLEITKKDTIFYSFAGIADTMSYQMFSFYIFNYYLSVKGLPLFWVVLGFIIWTIWNALNDPLLGSISDRTSSKWGRRKPFIIAGWIPLIALVILVWTVFGSELVVFIYFIIIINVFDTFYTMYSLNQTALFPEMFQDLEKRAKANNYVQVFNIIGLLLAALIPTLFVPDQIAPGSEPGYILGAIIMAILAFIFGLIFIKFGIKERVEFSKDPKQAPSFFKAVKFSFKNKPFRTYVFTNLSIWYVFGLVPIMNPYFMKFIIGITGFLPSVFLALLFISAIAFMTVWSKIFAKFGPKKGELMAMGALIITMIPFLFISNIIGAILTYIAAGFGFAGIMFGRDIMMSTIIDTDEIETGIRREAAYYGVNALIIRLSTIGVYLSIFFVFGVEFGGLKAIFDPTVVTSLSEGGIRTLMYILPSIGLLIGMILLWVLFPVTKEKYEIMRKDLERIHEDKKQKVDINKYEDIF
ncbi:MAG: MFS transporter [Candidatus Lokiarchaeota archaeon]